MKTLTESITINESHTSERDIEKYIKSWTIQCTTAEEYERLLHAIKSGLEEGIKDNLRYLKDEEEQKATKKLDDIVTDWEVPSVKLGDWD